MSRYTGPKIKISRRLGNLPGLTRKISKKISPAGEHGQQLKKQSEYALRLKEKQKLKFNYGLNEKQLLNNIKIAKKIKGPTGIILLQMLEMRLDNIIFRFGLAPTIPASRQLVNHKHIIVNNEILSICSYQCRPGDTIKIKQKTSSINLIKNFIKSSKFNNIPNHLELQKNKLIAKVNNIIERDCVSLQVNELLIVEYYSNK
uniref:30S ribosomal protein S4 n=1 Tax=Choreocolax polysiphoniae TaxID=282351 RepID=A0A0B5W2J7_9FLOR|nr:30S ribosomal protein S4 [Choreocolax polysiphoniae]AJH65874.1 30S ribosomal protein S4 [Choreocolax polysiphoniae]